MTDQTSEKRVLVIDDEVFIRELLEEYFSRLDFEVVTAESGDQGIERVSADRFSTALVDLKMPGKDGIETLREIRQIDPNCMIIVMTGYPTIDSSIEALRAGAYDYIIKPFKLSELREVVERAIKEYCLKAEIEQIQDNIEIVEGEMRDYLAKPRQDRPSTALHPHNSEKYIQGQVRELDRLREAGYLSGCEYEQKKRDLLARR